MLVFHIITLVILYIPVSQNIEGLKEKVGERERDIKEVYEIGIGFNLKKNTLKKIMRIFILKELNVTKYTCTIEKKKINRHEVAFLGSN